MKIVRMILIAMMCLCAGPLLKAQHILYAVSAHHQHAAQYAASVTNAFTCTSNPALIPLLGDVSIGMFAEKRFLARELMLVSAAGAINYGNNGFVLGLRHFGGIDYNEKFASVGYGKSLGRINIGILFNYTSFKIPRSRYTFGTYGIAAVWKMSDKIYYGVSIINPRLFFLKKHAVRPRLPSAFHFGTGCEVSDKLYVGIESGKEEERPLMLVAALRYFFNDKYYVRTSWNTAGNQPFMHIGWQQKYYRLEVGFSYHQSLGYSPSFAAIYQPRKLLMK